MSFDREGPNRSRSYDLGYLSASSIVEPEQKALTPEQRASKAMHQPKSRPEVRHPARNDAFAVRRCFCCLACVLSNPDRPISCVNDA